MFINMKMQAKYFVEKLEQMQNSKSKSISFTFVESEFLTAVRNGYWVLLDNVNSAPPEVLRIFFTSFIVN